MPSPTANDPLAERQVAATLGAPFDVVTRLSDALEKSPPAQNASISEWRCWIFKWLEANPDVLDKVFRKRTLDELFGDKLKRLLEVKERSDYALPFPMPANEVMDGRKASA